MTDIMLEASIAAAPDTVFTALTEQQGLESWWAPRAIAEPIVGSTVQAIFRGGQFVTSMTLARLDRPRKVEWIPDTAVPEWTGTHISWDLASVESGTKVMFSHRDFALNVATIPNNAWTFYLNSLKAYVYTGTGQPGGFVVRG